ncbi:DUF6602 domain-containing protein [Paraburkholderia fungorum]|uniref:DUF6602 domain-containing protein n=1 Tax=Paraburkholderia fungorum TaxID=134537 RepID=A0A3R7FBH8_9BURK|nr:DUF6602 domain-containing protein [Paraburkholderia fungorum]RKF50129.1 hypothetical protein BCY88_15325 [Paraburkholderia fungorum]
MSKPTQAKRPIRKRLTNAQKVERREFAEREVRTREVLTAKVRRAADLRSKDRAFHGLEREFSYFQDDLLKAFDRTKNPKHPRDVGTAREQVLRRYLVDTGLIPNRYAVTSTSHRVASTSGHISRELDLLFYDSSEAITLMQVEKAYSVLPVECTYGVIQVKSRVSRNDIREGLLNIASYKKLSRTKSQGFNIISGDPKSEFGFGILFAYDTDLDWHDLVDELKVFTETNPRHTWPNAVFVLSKGFLLCGDETQAAYTNGQIAAINNPEIHGRPDRDNSCFFSLYTILIDLLRNTATQPIVVNSYYRLPLVAGEHSYKYSFGFFAEIGACDKHGDYPRKLTESKLIEVIEWCKTATPINWVRATELAYGQPGDNWEAYERQNAEVRIYNPKNIALPDLLVLDTPMMADGKEVTVKSNAFDSIEVAGMIIWIPYIYEIEQEIINFCPKCEKIVLKTAENDDAGD